MKHLFLHIGTLKTGSTSIQSYLANNAEELRQKGFALYPGLHKPFNQIELFLATMRYERDSFAKLAMQHKTQIDEAYTEAVRQRVGDFIEVTPQPKIILTTEGLSLLRYDDEVERLKSVLGKSAANTKIILCLRNKADFLRSYTRQLEAKPGRLPSSDPESSLYVEQDSWLTDYDNLLSIYRRGFGTENVKIIDYDAEMEVRGNILPSFLEIIDYRGDDNYNDYFLNRS